MRRIQHPMRANLTLWAAVAAIAAGLAFALRQSVGLGYHLGDLGAIALMVAGAMIALKGQDGIVRTGAAAED